MYQNFALLLDIHFNTKITLFEILERDIIRNIPNFHVVTNYTHPS